MHWIISANGRKYNHNSAFKKWGFIDWKQGNTKYSVGDIVYIYCTSPCQKVMYKTQVERVHLSKNEIVNDSEFWYDKAGYTSALDGYYARLRLLVQVDKEELALKHLLDNGLNAAPQGPARAKPQLIKYIDEYMDREWPEVIFPDSADTDTCIEGAKTVIQVNKYERSSTARRKCIEANGCYCNVCGMSFEAVYGDLGKGFIHVHHIVPLNEIQKDYIVDPINDLIPVCPNCHAMLHQKRNGRTVTPQELKSLLMSNKRS